MSFTETAGNIIRSNTLDPGRRVYNNVTSQRNPFDVPGALVTSILGETVRLPLENIGKLSSWTLKRMADLLGGTLKLGAQAAMLIPIPLPGGMANLADLRGNTNAMRQALTQRAQGSPQTFREIFANIRGIRDDAQERTNVGNPAQPTV